MTDEREMQAAVDRLFGEYLAAERAGSDPDPLEYLSKLDGGERRELVELIDGFLSRAPAREWDEKAYDASPAKRIAERFAQDAAARGGRWPQVLPKLRHAAQLKREELVERLAAVLDAPDQAAKVGGYYHEMEHGLIEPAGVSDQVLEALGGLVGRSAQWLREQGEGIGEWRSSGEYSAAFTRIARPDPEYPRVPQSPGMASPETAELEWDEIDELFKGRRVG